MKLIKNLSALEFVINLIVPVLFAFCLVILLPVLLIVPSLMEDLAETTRQSYLATYSIGMMFLIVLIGTVITLVIPIIMKICIFKNNIGYLVASGFHMVLYITCTTSLSLVNYSKVENGSLNSLYNLIIFFLVIIIGANIPTKVLLIQNMIKEHREKVLNAEKLREFNWYREQQEELDEQIAEIRSHVKCKYCDSVVPYNNGLCSHCGAKLVI
ncbi:hypothetical protein [Butyrivibrio proteoclasticus]|uniref:hypothetical protein n=1 Tax=Butyrivibrio proteoclasticus TaxID=43305 RepID=UPI00047B2C3D|nr:hypothetical protein [Butyrivibrio proteoclasticus]